jgi:hypothetical protein
MIEETAYFPAWQHTSIIEDSLPWESGKTYSYPEFKEKYTLHDSSWIGLFSSIRYENSAILALLWDAHWIPDEIFESTGMVTEWPFLFIKLESLVEIVTRNLAPFDYPREIHHATLVEFEDGLKTLVVTGDGGDIEIGFRGKSVFLGLDREKQPLLI